MLCFRAQVYNKALYYLTVDIRWSIYSKYTEYAMFPIGPFEMIGYVLYRFVAFVS